MEQDKRAASPRDGGIEPHEGASAAERVEDIGPLESTEPIHHQLLVAFAHSNRAMLSRAREIGLKPGQPKVLEYVVFHEGCAQRDIARACVMDASTVTSVVTRMEEEGFLERRAKPGDRRGVAIHLTARGRDAAARVLGCCSEVDGIAWEGLEPAERAELSRLLSRVIRNLAKQGEGKSE